MEKVTAQRFYEIWLEIVESRKENLSAIWKQNKTLTTAIKDDEKSVIAEVADKLHLMCYAQDYYSIDAILYEKEDLVPDEIRPKDSFWFRRIRVAFEHENHFYSGLHQEISHLLITNCDLRVLVTYPKYDFKELKEPQDFYKIIRGSGQSEAISKDGSFLLIFGYQTDFTWQGYVYNEEKEWIELGR